MLKSTTSHCRADGQQNKKPLASGITDYVYRSSYQLMTCIAKQCLIIQFSISILATRPAQFLAFVKTFRSTLSISHVNMKSLASLPRGTVILSWTILENESERRSSFKIDADFLNVLCMKSQERTSGNTEIFVPTDTEKLYQAKRREKHHFVTPSSSICRSAFLIRSVSCTILGMVLMHKNQNTSQCHRKLHYEAARFHVRSPYFSHQMHTTPLGSLICWHLVS